MSYHNLFILDLYKSLLTHSYVILGHEWIEKAQLGQAPWAPWAPWALTWRRRGEEVPGKRTGHGRLSHGYYRFFMASLWFNMV